MISEIIDVCKSIIDYTLRNNEIKEQKQEKISSLLLEISEILNDTAEKLSKDEYPHDNCVVMQRLSTELHSNLLEFLPKKDVNVLKDSLMEASQIEKQFTLRKDIDTIPSIKRAAGEFRVMSILLKFRNTVSKK
jgi:hypothetical protein